MQMAMVVGKAISTLKHPSMLGMRLLVVQPYLLDGQTPDGFPQLVVDTHGAGLGERVLITSDGRHAREVLKIESTPVRWTVIGICDA